MSSEGVLALLPEHLPLFGDVLYICDFPALNGISFANDFM